MGPVGCVDCTAGAKCEDGAAALRGEIMLRIHFLQQWFNLSDPAMEEALYDMLLFQQFAGLDVGNAGCRMMTWTPTVVWFTQ